MNLTTQRPRIYRGWWIVFAGFLGQMTSVGAQTYGLSALIQPMERSLGWSRSEIVGVVTVARLLGGATSAALGVLVDRYGSRLLMSVSALVLGICLIFVGFVTTLWQYYLLMGIGLGLTFPGLFDIGPRTAIANWFIRKRALAFTLFILGSAAAGIIIAPIIAWTEHYADWRTAWMMMGALTLAVIPVAWFSIRRRPEDIGLLPDGDAPGESSQSLHGALTQSGHSSEEPEWTAGDALRTRSFWLVTFAFMLVSLPASAITIHMAPYVGTKGFSTLVGVSTLSFHALGGVAGRVVWGLLIARFGVYSMAVAFGLFYGVSIIAFLLTSSPATLYLTAAMVGASIGGLLQVRSHIFPAYFGRRIVGRLTGYSATFETITGAVTPLFAALMYDATQSYVLTFSIFAAACFVTGMVFLLAPPPPPGQRTS